MAAEIGLARKVARRRLRQTEWDVAGRMARAGRIGTERGVVARSLPAYRPEVLVSEAEAGG